MKAGLVVLCICLAFASAATTRRTTTTRSPTTPKGEQVTRTAIVTVTDNFVRVNLARALSTTGTGAKRIGGDRLMFEFRVAPIARVLFSYWSREKATGTGVKSASRLNWRFAFWAVVAFEETSVGGAGYDSDDIVHRRVFLWGNQATLPDKCTLVNRTYPVWNPIQNTVDKSTTPAVRTLTGSLTNGGFAFSVDFAENTGCTTACDFTKSGTAYSADGLKANVLVKPDVLFPGVTWTTNSRVAVHFRMVTRTRTFTLVNGTAPGANPDLTVTDGLSSSVSTLDRTCQYATTAEATTYDTTTPPVIISKWFHTNASTVDEDNEMEPDDHSYFFYATFDISPLTAKRIYWDPYFGVDGGDMGSAASSVVLNAVVVLVALVGLLAL